MTTPENKATTRNIMLLPSLACQAECKYCFGPNRGSTMPKDIFDAAVEWVEYTTPKDKNVHMIFHGGEPLLAGFDWFKRNFSSLNNRFEHRLQMSIQSNLWLLDEKFCKLFKKYGVTIGTSLDGPEHLNDLQRGNGYFARTMAGIRTACYYGLYVGVNCTFTPLSTPHYKNVLTFFEHLHINCDIRGSVPTLGGKQKEELTLSSAKFAETMTQLIDYYLDNTPNISISTFDRIARSIPANQGSICTFQNCLGEYMAIGPEGGIYPCNRFVNIPKWRLGFVQQRPSLEKLTRSPGWQRLREREEKCNDVCGKCDHFGYCRGGCAYNAIVFDQDCRDPYCSAYAKIFDHIINRALCEIFSDKNLDAVIKKSNAHSRGIIQKSNLLNIMQGRSRVINLKQRMFLLSKRLRNLFT